jgi:hypothetical protein
MTSEIGSGSMPYLSRCEGPDEAQACGIDPTLRPQPLAHHHHLQVSPAEQFAVVVFVSPEQQPARGLGPDLSWCRQTLDRKISLRAARAREGGGIKPVRTMARTQGRYPVRGAVRLSEVSGGDPEPLDGQADQSSRSQICLSTGTSWSICSRVATSASSASSAVTAPGHQRLLAHRR